MNAVEMWQEYTQINKGAKKYEAWAFGGNTPEMPDVLANLVKQGVKTATASAYPCYIEEQAPLPEVGDYSVILNTKGEAVCVIQTLKVELIPFNQVTAEHAWKEGEFERTLAAWRKCHAEVFTKELREIGQVFSEEMLVVCETFKLVYPETIKTCS